MTRLLLPRVAAVAALLSLAPLSAELAAPAGGEELSAGGKLSAYSDAAHGTAGETDGVWQVDVTRPDDSRPYVAQVSMTCPQGALAPGDLVLAIIKARATRGAAPSVEAKLQLAAAPYTAAAPSTGLDLTGEWRELPVLFPITTALGKGGAALTLLCGRQAQSVEIASIRVFKYPAGTDTSAFPRIRKTYAGREPDAPWREAALGRIEQHRKADLSLRVRGPDGQPLANTEVTLTLRRHEFGFGSAVTAGWLTAETGDGKRYREIVDRLFSQIVFENDLKDFGWEEGAAGKEAKLKQLDQAMLWLEQRRISIRGHYLIQGAVPPNLAELTDPEAISQHYLKTAEERLAFAKDRVCEWDVVNHPVAWGGADLLTRRPGLEKIDREIHQLATRDLLIACFSHPAYTGFLLWGFWEGRHWKPEAASWNLDWSIRQRGAVLEEWIGRRWHTTVTLGTGNDGIVRWRGFPGWYEIRSGSGGKSAGFEVTKAVPGGTVDLE